MDSLKTARPETFSMTISLDSICSMRMLKPRYGV